VAVGNGLAEAEKLAELARERENPTAVGLQARSHPALACAVLTIPGP
jgi:predicted dehydrogenase